MRRIALVLGYFLLMVPGGLQAAADAPAVSAPAVPRCHIFAYYAEKRPYESPNSDPFYAAMFWLTKPYDRHMRSAHLIVRTQSGLFERESIRGAFEFTLPTHESVVSAWVDSTEDRDGKRTACDLAGAFFVDGFGGVPFTKQYLKHEKTGRLGINETTQFDLGFGLRVRHPGRRPAGMPIALPEPCNEPDRNATLSGSLSISTTQAPGVGVQPTVLVDLSPYGSVMDIDIEQSAGSRALDDAMIAAAKAGTFSAARWKCVPVPDRLIVPVQIQTQAAR